MRKLLLKALAVACILDGIVEFGIAAYGWVMSGTFTFELPDHLLAILALCGGVMLFHLSRKGAVILTAWGVANICFVLFSFFYCLPGGNPFASMRGFDLYYEAVSSGLLIVLFALIITFLWQWETRRLYRDAGGA